MPTVEQLVTLARVSLLEQGGVDNWEWYSESLENYGYVKSEDVFKDAENFLEALMQGGVTNWDWYGDSVAGLDEYEEYLESLPNLNFPLDVTAWKGMVDAAEKLNPASVVAAPMVEEVTVEKRRLVGGAEGILFAHIVSRFGDDRAEDVYDLAVEKGVWKQTAFPREFRAALKLIVGGVSNPLEVARKKLMTDVIKNGKLDVFLDGIMTV